MRLSALPGFHVVHSATAFPFVVYLLQAMQPCSCPHRMKTVGLDNGNVSGEIIGATHSQNCQGGCQMRNTGLYNILLTSGKQGEGWYYQLHFV